MRIDLEQFLAMTVALGAIGAVGVGVYSARSGTPDFAGEVQTMETFGDDLDLELEPGAAASSPAAQPPLLSNPPAPDYADEVPTEVAANDIAGPDVESPNW